MKRILSFIVMVCLTLGISAYASNDIRYTGINDKVLEYTIGTEPIIFAGRVCVPYTVFSRDVGISSIYSPNRNVLTMYDLNHIVTFDLSSSTIQDENLTLYSGSAFFRGSVIYVPAEVVSEIFELNYITMSSETDIVRIYNDNAKLTNDVFATLVDATYRSSQYLESQTDSQGETEQTNPNSQTSTVTPTESEEDINVSAIMPVFVSTAIKDVVDVFDERQLTYFVDESSFSNEELIRYIYIKNHTIGIYVPSEIYDVDEYISNINNQLFRILGTKTRVIFAQDDEILSKLNQDRYVVIQSDYDYYSSSQITKSEEETLVIDLTLDSYINNFLAFCDKNDIELLSIDEFNVK